MTEIHTEKTENSGNTLKDRVVFFFVVMGVITLTYGFLYAVDFLPEKKEVADEALSPVEPKQEEVIEDVTEDTTESVDPLPRKIIFDSLDREVVILNPESKVASVLDTALLQGVVRHPDSADFAEKGTIFLLGHSSYLPVVRNKSFQAFNGIQKMKWGDTIRVQSTDTEYVYSVDRVYQAKASDASVAIQYETAKLTLATCNSFGAKEDRYILEATLVETRPLAEDSEIKG